MSLPPIGPSKQQHDNKVTASYNFEGIKWGSRNREGKEDEDQKSNIHHAMLKLDELQEGESMQDSNRDMIQNQYKDDSEEEEQEEEQADENDAPKEMMLDPNSPPRLSAHYASLPMKKSKQEFKTPPLSKGVNNPYVSIQENSRHDSILKTKDFNKELVGNVYGIKYLEMIMKDKSLGKGAQINSKKIQAEINSMKAPIEINEWDIKNDLLKFILNDKEDEFFTELENIKLLKNIPHRDESNTNINKDSIINTSINAHTVNKNENKSFENRITTDLEYKYNVLMWFWFALHLEKTYFIQRLTEIEDIVNKVILNLIKKYNVYIEIEQNDSVSDSNDEADITKTKLMLQK